MTDTEAKKCMTASRADVPVPLCGDVDNTPWASAEPISISEYPWYEGGLKQSTTVRVLYDDKSVYVQFLCEDIHSSAEIVELNGNVCLDSCVEMFATVDPKVGPGYFNLEINCCGTILLGFGDDRYGRRPVTPELAERIRVATSEPGATKQETPDDKSWWAAAALPYDVISELAGRSVKPQPAGWLANFYRCGGKTESQCACWNHIDWEKPDFHRPDFFGKMLFS